MPRSPALPDVLSMLARRHAHKIRGMGEGGTGTDDRIYPWGNERDTVRVQSQGFLKVLPQYHNSCRGLSYGS